MCVCVCMYVCICICMYVYIYVLCMYVCFFNLFIILHAPLLWSNTTCNGGFSHYFHSHYIISTKIIYSVYKLV
jgi:hypothetical protein